MWLIILQITGGIVLLALAIWIEWGMTENSRDHWYMLGSSKPQWDARPLTENTHRGRLEVVPGDPVLSGNEITNIPLIVRNPGKVAVTIKAVRSRTRPVKLFGSTELDFDLLKRTPCDVTLETGCSVVDHADLRAFDGPNAQSEPHTASTMLLVECAWEYETQGRRYVHRTTFCKTRDDAQLRVVRPGKWRYDRELPRWHWSRSGLEEKPPLGRVNHRVRNGIARIPSAGNCTCSTS